MVLVGVSEVNITPQGSFPLGGYLERYYSLNRSTGVIDDIFLRTLYIEKYGVKILLFSVDVLVFENDYVETVKNELSERFNIPKENIIIAATHTHSAPEVTENMPVFSIFLEDEDRKLIKEYKDFLFNKFLEATEKAVKDVYETDLYVGLSTVEGVCSNRINPNLIKDDEVLVLTDKFRKFVAYFYTCHPTVLGAKNMEISGDFPAYTNKMLKERLGQNTVTIFFNGAAGDQSTRFTRKNQTRDEAKRIGERLAEKVLEALNNKEKLDVKEITVKNKVVELEKRNVFEEKLDKKLTQRIEFIREKIEEVKDPGEKRKLEVELSIASALLEFLPEYQKYLDSLPDKIYVNVSIVKIGDLTIYSIPGELFCKYGLEIKKNSGAKYTVVVAYANGYNGYLPTPETYDELDYEALISFIKKGETERLVKEIIEL